MIQASLQRELRLHEGTQTVTILTGKTHPKGLCRGGRPFGKALVAHMFVALGDGQVGFLRLNEAHYIMFKDAIQNLPPEKWTFKVQCTVTRVGGAEIPQITSIRPTQSTLTDKVTKMVETVFFYLAGPTFSEV